MNHKSLLQQTALLTATLTALWSSSPVAFASEKLVNSTMPQWAMTYTDFVLDNGIMPNMTRPSSSKPSSRGLIAESLYNLYGNGQVIAIKHGFSDLGNYDVPVSWAFSLGIMTGRDTGDFDPSGSITREQFALVLRQLAVVQGKSLYAEPGCYSHYPDADEVSDWTQEAVSWAVTQGLMSGWEGNLLPKGYLTEIQVAVMIYQYHHL